MEGMPDRLKQHRSKERLLDYLGDPRCLGAGKYTLRRISHHQHHGDVDLGEDGLTLAVQYPREHVLIEHETVRVALP